MVEPFQKEMCSDSAHSRRKRRWKSFKIRLRLRSLPSEKQRKLPGSKKKLELQQQSLKLRKKRRKPLQRR